MYPNHVVNLYKGQLFGLIFFYCDGRQFISIMISFSLSPPHLKLFWIVCSYFKEIANFPTRWGIHSWKIEKLYKNATHWMDLSLLFQFNRVPVYALFLKIYNTHQLMRIFRALLTVCSFIHIHNNYFAMKPFLARWLTFSCSS